MGSENAAAQSTLFLGSESDDACSAAAEIRFDRAAFVRNVRSLAQLFGFHNALLLFSVKSCFDQTLFSIVKAAGCGFDAANGKEFQRVEQFLDRRTEVSISGPALEFYPLTNHRTDAITVNCDSIEQLRRCRSRSFLERARMGLRLKRVSPGAPQSRFGFDPTQIECAKAEGTLIQALHIHESGIPKTLEYFRACVEESVKLCETHFPHVTRLNLGGGLERLTLDEISSILGDLRHRISPGTVLAFEPGELYFRDSLSASGKVLHMNIDDHRETVSIISALSRECHLRWSHPRLRIGGEPRGRAWRVRVFGPTCHELDHIGDYVVYGSKSELRMRLGDRVTFGNISPYSVAWNTSFNGIPRAEVITA